MKKYLTVENDDGSETRVEEPQSEYGFTYADYLNWNYKERLELIYGRIFKMSAPTITHQVVLGTLYVEFYQFLQNQPCRVFLSPIDVRLKGRGNNKKKFPDSEIKTVVQPDLVVVCDPEKLTDDRSIDGAPDLAIEILSPGSSTRDKREKLLLYEENEVKEYWIADPKKKTVTQFVLSAAGQYEDIKTYRVNDSIQSAILPGFQTNVSTIFK